MRAMRSCSISTKAEICRAVESRNESAATAAAGNGLCLRASTCKERLKIAASQAGGA